MPSDASQIKGRQTCNVTVEAFLWQVDRDPQFSAFGLLVATFFMLKVITEGVYTVAILFTLHHEQTWRRISGWEGDAPVTLQGSQNQARTNKVQQGRRQS